MAEVCYSRGMKISKMNIESKIRITFALMLLWAVPFLEGAAVWKFSTTDPAD